MLNGGQSAASGVAYPQVCDKQVGVIWLRNSWQFSASAAAAHRATWIDRPNRLCVTPLRAEELTLE